MQNLRLDYKQSRYFRHYFKDLLRIDDKKMDFWHAYAAFCIKGLFLLVQNARQTQM